MGNQYKRNILNEYVTKFTQEQVDDLNSKIKITVFDISGQKVQSLLNSFQISGYHSIKWDASSLSSGLYFFQLKTDNYIETRKITYLK